MKFPMDRPVKVVMLGAGGTGGYVAPYLFRLLHMLDRPARFIICDGDLVEAKNLDRQNFVEADLGENKARVLSERYSAVLGMETEYVPNFIETLSELMTLIEPGEWETDDYPRRKVREMVLLLGCVDNNRTRQLCHEAFKKSLDLIYIDSGNGSYTGQVVCGVRKNGRSMCEKNHCSRTPEDICTCMDWQNDDLIRTVTHLAENITDIDWELDYKDLADVQGHRLCLIGRCKKCGGRLCISQTPKIKVSPEQILSALDDSIGQAYSALKVNLQPEEYYDKFAEMFHEEDRPVVDKWVMHQRCYSPYLKGYKHSRPAYMIVHTSADADKGNFPDPEGLETFLCKDRAILRLRELVEMEKEEMTFPYDEELYREEYGDDFWEACCDNYAAGWFTRYEIIESPLFLAPEDELRTPNPSYSRFTNTRTDLNDCLTSIREDTHLSDAEAGAGKGLFKAVLSLCQDYGMIKGFDCDKVDSVFDHLENRSEALTE